MKRNDRRGLELLCVSIIGWGSLQSALFIGCDVTKGVGTLIITECGEEWVVPVQQLEWENCSGGEGYFEHFEGACGLFAALDHRQDIELSVFRIAVSPPSSQEGYCVLCSFFFVACLLTSVCHRYDELTNKVQLWVCARRYQYGGCNM